VIRHWLSYARYLAPLNKQNATGFFQAKKKKERNIILGTSHTTPPKC